MTFNDTLIDQPTNTYQPSILTIHTRQTDSRRSSHRDTHITYPATHSSTHTTQLPTSHWANHDAANQLAVQPFNEPIQATNQVRWRCQSDFLSKKNLPPWQYMERVLHQYERSWRLLPWRYSWNRKLVRYLKSEQVGRPSHANHIEPSAGYMLLSFYYHAQGWSLEKWLWGPVNSLPVQYCPETFNIASLTKMIRLTFIS